MTHIQLPIPFNTVNYRDMSPTIYGWYGCMGINGIHVLWCSMYLGDAKRDPRSCQSQSTAAEFPLDRYSKMAGKSSVASMMFPVDTFIYFGDVPASYGWLPEGTVSLMRNPAALKIGVLVRRWCNVISRRLATFSKLGRVPWQQKISRLIFLWMKMMKCSFWRLLWTSRLRLGSLVNGHCYGKLPFFIGESVSHLDGPWLSKVWSCTRILRISQSETQAPQ